MFYKPINAIITTNKKFNQINLGGLVTLYADDINTDDLELNVGGEMPACTLQGKVNNFVFHSGGAFNLNAKGLRANSVDISMAGKGNAIVNAKNRITVSGFGMGTISYYGNPKQVEESSFGKIVMINMSKDGIVR